MKKLKVLLVASSLFLSMGLAGCGTTTKSSSTTPISDSTSTDSTDYATLAKQALAQVATSLSKYATVTGVSANFDLIVKSTVVAENGKSYEFDIVYSVATDYASSLAISTDGKKCLVTPENTVNGGVDKKCKLHADAKINGEVKASEDFNILVKAITVYTIQDIYGLTEGTVVTYGIFTGYYGTDYQAMIGDGDYGLTLYQFKAYDGMAVGDYVKVSGTVSPYSGLIELKPATIEKATAADCPNVKTPTALAVDSTNAPALTAKMASRAITVADGLVTSVAGTVGGNITVRVKVGTTAYTIFENSTYNTAADYATFQQTRAGAAAATLIGVNDVISISGWTSIYTDPQIIGAKVTKWTEGVAPSDTPITIADLDNVGWKADTSYVTQGFVTGYYSGIGTPKNGMFISDGVNGLDIYSYTGDCTAFTVGTCVTVIGSPSVFNGLIEFTATKISVTATADITAKAAVTVDVAGTTGIANSNISRPVHATGILQAAITGTYGTNNATAKLTVGNGATLPVYLHKSNITEAQYNAWKALAVGDEVEVTGWLANYKSNTTTWAADLVSGAQVVSPTIVKTVAAASITKLAPAMTLADAGKITTTPATATAVDTIGFYTGSYATNAYQGIYIADDVNGGLVHGAADLPLGTVAGTPLHVVGTASPYNALPEIEVSNGSIVAIPSTMVDASVKAAAAALVLSDTVVPAATNLNRAVTASGTIKAIKTAVVAGKTNGSYTLTVGTTDMTLYVNKASLAADVYTTMATVAVGGKLSLNGFVGCYNANMQIVNPSNLVYTAA